MSADLILTLAQRLYKTSVTRSADNVCIKPSLNSKNKIKSGFVANPDFFTYYRIYQLLFLKEYIREQQETP